MSTNNHIGDRQIIRKQLAAAIIAATLTGGALAQGATTDPTGTATPGATTNPAAVTQQNAADAAAAQVSDEQLKKFASAQEEVDEIRTKYVKEVQGEENPQKRAEVETEMQKEMIEAVSDNELDVPTYNRIAQLLPLSANLQQRLQQAQ